MLFDEECPILRFKSSIWTKWPLLQTMFSLVDCECLCTVQTCEKEKFMGRNRKDDMHGSISSIYRGRWID